MNEPDFREQPRCANCYHRRIYHYRLVRARRGAPNECPTPCSIWKNREGDRCNCLAYIPSRALNGIVP